MIQKYQKSFLATNVSLNTTFIIEKQKMIERYNKFSKFEAQNNLRMFVENEKFWKNIQTSLLLFDFTLKQSQVELVLCDHFLEGVFIPKPEQKIVLCANSLFLKKDFDNALKR